MNDRFKFRVWNNKHKRYIEDNCYPIGVDYSLSMTQNGYVEVIGLGDYEEGSDTTHTWGCVKNLREYIGECIIEQCTGLKDKNGKLIYEGDIVDFDDSETYATIEWGEEDGCWRIITCEKSIYTFDNLYGNELTVIGNIHENADLLELKQDD